MGHFNMSDEEKIRNGYLIPISPSFRLDEVPPWRKPGYKGILRGTPSIRDVPEPTNDEMLQLAIEWNIEGILTDEQFSRISDKLL